MPEKKEAISAFSMKESRYNVWVHVPETGNSILYNTLYGSLTIWTPEEAEEAKKILSNPSANVDGAPVVREILAKQKNIVESPTDEFRIVEERKRRGVADSNRLDVIIMPTLECNFSCVYCYEDRLPGLMTHEIEESVKKWLEKEIPRFKFVILSWFGGEPLMGYRQLLSISKCAAEAAAKSNSMLALHITTNGYLLNKKRIRELVNAGIVSYQITVDGPPEIHDQFRILRSGGGSFNRIFKNIIHLTDADPKVKVSLRINFNDKNFRMIPKLLELFPDRVRPQLRVVFEPIFGQCSLSADGTMCSAEISKGLEEYYALADRLGFDVVFSSATVSPGKLVYCYAERENQYVINYNADVFKCSVGKFTCENRVGRISGAGEFVKETEEWQRWTGEPLFAEQCHPCKYLPLCMGGCRNKRQEDDRAGVNCYIIPSNTNYALKKIAYGDFAGTLNRGD